ncbi:MAG: ATP-binding cassette domain-containing protein [Actinobacteria bacterium]|nr:ATP-binding cassette domain-containing protein [Actinomycetota bacterium]
MTSLDDVTLSVGSGELVAVIGGRGSGKTTLLRLAAGIEHPDAGFVSIDGERLDRMSNEHRGGLYRGGIGCVLKTVAAIGHTRVVDLVALPLRLHTGAGRSSLFEAKRILNSVGAEHLADANPASISDGEGRLVALAQALIMRPGILLLDQPASDLSLEEEKSLLRVLSSIARDADVAVIMTARASIEAVTADRVAHINCGRLAVGSKPPPPKGASVLPLKKRNNNPEPDHA